ncbi:hypothetical protein JQ600_09405 [Bradyrhizobium sp. AUGA SZCCT0176]|uniref:hypothetical protein n=1 Tax=Bradyrhizobium sp. AUGA SZCCT0176 TaxID=2807664 RepID=UPI001BA5C721|nr:hypothetical protein [Bradyrhizobium sp. AUGA SZCCT0176]MBR1225132.1 hypothetical protein [Bradyrhizobium sp. AUGA SZCCT0176]
MSQSAKPLHVGDESASSIHAITPPPGRSMDVGATSRAAIQTWTGRAIGEQIHSKALNAAYRQWLFHKASRQPRLRDMFVQSSNAFVDTLLNLRVGNDHLVVAQSESYIANLGRDLRGTLASELKFATANSLRELFDDCLARMQPTYARYISSLSERNVYWETLILPLAAEAHCEPVFTKCYMACLSEQVDVLQILYDRSPVGIVAAVPIRNGLNKTDDARILTMNTKARQILKQDRGTNEFHSVGEMIRFISNGLHWTGINSSSEDHLTRIDYRDPAGEEFSLTIELINQFVLVSINERSRPEPRVTGRFARLLGFAS